MYARANEPILRRHRREGDVMAITTMKRSCARWFIILPTCMTVACGGQSCGSSRSSAGHTSANFSSDELRRPQIAANDAGAQLRQAGIGLAEAARGAQREITLDGVADRLALTIDAMRKALERIPRDTFDPQAVVDRAGRDADKLRNWVRDETLLVPYLGTLRGARGVLMDRVGNSLDRSLLLAELLTMTGHEVRLVRAKLSPSAAGALLQRLRSTPERPPVQRADPTAEIVDSFLQEYARQFGTPTGLLNERLSTLRKSVEAMGREVARRSEIQTSTLLQLAGASLRATRTSDEGYLSALADHWWVQSHETDAWVDLDPAELVDARGRPVAQVIETVRPDQIGDELRHTLRVRVVVECACGGQLVEKLVLDHTLRLNELSGGSIVVQQAPTGAPPDAGALANQDAWPTLKKWLDGQQEWMPMLAIGDKVITQSVFTTAGEVKNPGQAGSQRAAGGLLDAFGGGDAPNPDGGRLTAEFIDYELRTPGQPARIERRAVVDWIGQVRRGNGQEAAVDPSIAPVHPDLLNSTEILPLVAQPSAEFVAYSAAKSILARSDGLLKSLRNPPDKVSLERVSQSSGPFATELYELALVRRQWNPAGRRTYLPEANVLTRHQAIKGRGANGVQLWSAFDIVYNRIDALPSVDGADAVGLRMRQGVLDTNAEVMLDARTGSATNVSEVMAAGTAREWIVQSGNDTHPQVREAGSKGFLLVSQRPEKPGEAPAGGWWRIDPRDGSALGITPAGWGGVFTDPAVGQGMAEFAATHADTIRTIGVIFKYLMALACLAGAVRQMLKTTPEEAQYPLIVMAKGSITATLCTAGGFLGTFGVIEGGALGSLLSRSGDAISLVMTIWNWLS